VRLPVSTVSGSPGNRDRLYALAAADLTKLLTLQDRNPHSPTYGCFDRNYWHLRIIGFPSGMAQEFVLPIALAYAHDFPGNRFHRHPALRNWIEAGIRYAASSAHRDGSCDDYYPFEKAAGATAFSLYAMMRAVDLAGLDMAEHIGFFERRGRWLARHREAGRLANHEALIANCLFRLASVTGASEHAELARERLKRVLAWQNGEGWFQEYQGCDPGYLTLTIGHPAEIDVTHPDLTLRPAIAKAVRFLAELQPPDGWLGGEWTSRNTNNYFPHGLEICGAWLPEALGVNDRAIAALADPPDYGDDHIIGHHCWSYLLAAQAWCGERSTRPAVPPAADLHWPAAGFARVVRGPLCLLVSLHKGGTYRLYRDGELVHSDTGVSLRQRHGRRLRTLVCHLWSDENEIEVGAQKIAVAGAMGFAKTGRMSPLCNVFLRLLMLTLGRFGPNLVRRLLQRLLIVGRPSSRFRFRRTFHLHDDNIQVEDHVSGHGDVADAGIGAAQTSIYTVMSNVFHHPQLQLWQQVPVLRDGAGGVTVEHRRSFHGSP